MYISHCVLCLFAVIFCSQETAVAQIKRRYATATLTEDDIHKCLYSM